MAVDRRVPTSASTPPVSGQDYMDAVSEEIGRLYEGICIELTDIAGDENDIVGVCTPYLTDGVKGGMLFGWKQGATQNSGAMTLVLSDGASPAEETAAIDIVDLSSNALVSGRVGANTHQVAYYSAEEAKLILLTDTRTTNRVLNIQEFTSSGTWSKPAGTPDDALVIIECWGAGGGGGSTARGGGGGGGSYVRIEKKGSELASSETVTIGAGGAVDAAGENTTFGTLATAYGGGRGGTASNLGGAGGGGGGGRGGVGSNGSNTANTNGANGGSGGILGGGGGGAGANGGGSDGSGGTGRNDGGTGSSPGSGGSAIDGGGGGGGGAHNTTAGSGGASVMGGGGGGGDSASGSDGSGGSSVFGGNGGASGAAGTAPGGGGGQNAAGARGFCRVRTIS